MIIQRAPLVSPKVDTPLVFGTTYSKVWPCLRWPLFWLVSLCNLRSLQFYTIPMQIERGLIIVVQNVVDLPCYPFTVTAASMKAHLYAQYADDYPIQVSIVQWCSTMIGQDLFIQMCHDSVLLCYILIKFILILHHTLAGRLTHSLHFGLILLSLQLYPGPLLCNCPSAY
jgi:hypothetical protein